jgi:flavin reductase (DIM6/NTAB) family NADH-FMN oxidoreductase RutF
MIDLEQRKKIIGAVNKITYGLYVVTSVNSEGKYNGQCCNSIMQITSTPARIAAGINKQNYTYEFIKQSGEFVVNILNVNQAEHVAWFGLKSGRTVDKFYQKKYHIENIKSPVLDDADAYLECKIVPELTIDAGTHVIFVADVVGGNLVREFEPITYNYYRQKKLEKSKI